MPLVKEEKKNMERIFSPSAGTKAMQERKKSGEYSGNKGWDQGHEHRTSSSTQSVTVSGYNILIQPVFQVEVYESTWNHVQVQVKTENHPSFVTVS